MDLAPIASSVRAEHMAALGTMTRDQRRACDRMVRAAMLAAAAGGTIEAHMDAILEQDARGTRG